MNKQEDNNKLFESTTVPLIDLVNSTHKFKVPEFQRDYDWKTGEKGEVHKLLTDIYETMTSDEENKIYFLGPIITYKEEKSSDHLLIDGQQRFTTMILLISALRDLTDEDTDEYLAYDEYLNFIDKSKAGSRKKTPRLNVSNNDAKQFFNELITGNDLSTIHTEGAAYNLHKAYVYCKKYLASPKFGLGGDLSDSMDFVNFMLDNVCVTWIEAKDLNKALVVFERMNDRGLPLTMADKVKHYILQTLIDDKEKFSEDSQIINKLWGDIEDNLRVSRFTFDRFIRYHLVAHYWDETYYTAKEVLPWFRSPKGKKTKLATNQINFLQKMKDDSELLKMFKKSHGLNDELNPSLHFPRSYFGSVSQHMPVLFAAATINDDDYFDKVALKMEGLIFIYSLADTKWNLLERELAEICTIVRSNNITKFRKKIDELIEVQISQARANLTDHKYLEDHYMKSKFVLHRIDYEIGTRFKFDPSIKREQYTLEHIIPQNSPEGLEASKPPKVSLDEYSKLRHRIGNMTILSKSNNSKKFLNYRN